MPTERFYRLPKEKQTAICNAAIREFVRVPFEKASINRIIQDAEISRGSFYTYFDDKMDLLFLLFRDMNESMRRACEYSLKKHRGDFWKMADDLLEYTLEYCEDKNISLFFKNTMPFHRSMGFKRSMCREEAEMNQESYSILYHATDKTKLRIENQEEYQMLLDMCMANMMIGIAQYFQKPEEAESIKSVFHKKMNLLRYGVNQ